MDESDTVKELKKIFGFGVCGAVCNIFCTVTGKFARGEEVSMGDVVKAGLIGSVSTVAGQFGQKRAIKDETFENRFGNEAKKHRLEAGAAAGAVGGAVTAALIKTVENMLYCGSLTQKDFTTTMEKEGMACDNGKIIYEFLCQNEIVVDNVVRKRIPRSSQFSDTLKSLHLEEFEEKICDLVNLTHEEDIIEGVADAASENAITGAILGAVTAGADISLDVEELRKLADERSKKIACPGEWAGSIESEAYARAYKKRLIVHHDDGTVTAYGSPTNEEVHIHYSAQKEHYSPADKDGSIISSESTNYGDCFYEAIAYQTGESIPNHIRDKISKFLGEHPDRLVNTRYDEFENGGDDLGGARKKMHLTVTPDDKSKAMQHFESQSDCMKESAKSALKSLKNFKLDKLNDMFKGNSTEYKGRHKIHVMTRELREWRVLAVDVEDEIDENRAQDERGPVRMVFRHPIPRQPELKYIGTTLTHSYNQVVADYFISIDRPDLADLFPQEQR